MEERLKKKVRAFLLGMAFPILISSGSTEFNTEDLKESMLNSAKHYFISNDMEYTPYEFLLPSDEVIDKIIEASKTTKECSFIWDGDIEQLKETIKNNSIQFLEHYRGESAFYCAESDVKLKKIQLAFEKALDEALVNFVLTASNNINEDVCRLQKVVIIFEDIEDNYRGTYSYKDNKIILNKKYFFEFYDSFTSASDYVDFILETLIHELNHARQYACEDRMQANQKCVNVFPYIDFAKESSATSAIYNVENGQFPHYTYTKERECEALLFLYAICNEDICCEDYYNAIFDSNLEEFYKFLGCKSDEDIYSIYKILGSMETAVGRNQILDGIAAEEIERALEYKYKINIYHHVLSNMIDYTYNHTDFSLEDNLALFKIVKYLICCHSYEKEETPTGDLKRIYDKEFVTSFKNAEDIYFRFLCTYYHTNLYEIAQMDDYVNGYVSTFGYLSKSNPYFEHVKALVDRFPLLDAIFKDINATLDDYYTLIEYNTDIYDEKNVIRKQLTLEFYQKTSYSNINYQQK